MPGSVSVTIVTYNSAPFIRRSLQYVFEQDYPHIDVVVIDNASTDDTPKILREFETRARVIYNPRNTGFAAAQNQAIALSENDWVLTLNPDVRLTRDFIATLIAAGETSGEIGSISGKLLAMAADFEIPANPVFDSTGIFFTPALRHFDRGSREPDDGRYDRLEYVFGVTGAAALYRRAMIENISVEGEFFDSAFFAYREDADVAWRAQLLGWKCLYMPRAVAYHVRTVLPQNRRAIDPVLNMHSVKNRFLMRIANITADLYLRNLASIAIRDCVVIAACLLRETSSLAAFPLLFRNLRRSWRKRKQIMSARRVTKQYIAAWFSNAPVSYPASEIAAALEAQQIASR